jgi:glycerol-3-phosphate dehydrogenase (NAD(P)+)
VTLGAQPPTFAASRAWATGIFTATGALPAPPSASRWGRGRRSSRRWRGSPPWSKAEHDAHRGRARERHGVELPIAREVSNVLFEHKPPQQAISDLMERELKAESR